MKKNYEIKGHNGDIKIFLSEEAKNNLEDSKGVLVILFYKENLVMSYHTKRKGWEFPAGTKEEGETVLECAARETYEETGAELSEIKPIGYYTVQKENEISKYAIFIGEVSKFNPKPRWSETDLVKLFDRLPKNTTYNDDVYSIIIDYIRNYKE